MWHSLKRRRALRERYTSKNLHNICFRLGRVGKRGKEFHVASCKDSMGAGEGRKRVLWASNKYGSVEFHGQDMQEGWVLIHLFVRAISPYPNDGVQFMC